MARLFFGRVFYVKNKILRESLAECFATACLLYIGSCGIINSSVDQYVNPQVVYSLGLMMAVHVAYGVSGGHANPAVTLALCVTGRCRWNRLLPYWIAQYTGAFLGTALAHCVHFDTMSMLNDQSEVDLAILLSRPSDHVTLRGIIVDQSLGSALFLMIIMAITDMHWCSPPSWFTPLGAGLALLTTYGTNSANTGCPLNPAAQLAPRVYAWLWGIWNNSPFTMNDCDVWWLPLVTCHVGSVIGAALYFLLIEVQHHDPHTFRDVSKCNVEDDALFECELSSGVKPVATLSVKKIAEG